MKNFIEQKNIIDNTKLHESIVEKKEKEPKVIRIASINATAVTGSNYAIEGAFQVASQKEGSPKFDNTIFELLSNEHEIGYSEETLKELFNLLDDKDFGSRLANIC